METELGWKEAIMAVLSAAKTPMHYADIAAEIFSRELREEPTATPARTVAATIAQSFRNDGEHSPFIRVSRGVYSLRGTQTEAPAIVQKGQAEAEELAEAESSEDTGLVNAFGMFWDRSKVNWETEPRILGQQQVGSKSVNFCEQRGVYLLHDSQGVVYVGRATDQNLGRRLQQHTSDRLTGRWTRFSWFGVYPVKEDGTLKTSVDFSNLNSDIVIATMEAVLIEGLEPRQNRKRGDDFRAIEFLQVEDPKLEMNRKLAIVHELAAQLKA
jgi:HB1/ASXL restriction endonuclease-like protein with HTH domain